MKLKINSKLLTPQTMLAVLLAMALFFSFRGLSLAEDVADPPRLQQVGNYTVEFLKPTPGANHDAENSIPFQFKVSDSLGKPATGLNLRVTAIRDYSGQVKKEHNGPRTPNVGPLALKETAPGIYEANITFGFVGHWYIQVDGANFPEKAYAKFRTPIGATEGKGQGVGLDWLTWLGVLLVVITIVAVIGRKGDVFSAPPEELAEPTSAPATVGTTTSETVVANKPDPVKK